MKLTSLMTLLAGLMLFSVLGLGGLFYVYQTGAVVGAQHTNIPVALSQLMLWHTVLPRWVMAFLVGGGLALATSLLQQVTHNPLATDSTLAMSGGAYLLLLLVTLFAPALLLWLNPAIIALIGVLSALLLVLLLAYRGSFSPTRLLLAGLILNLYLGAVASALAIFYPEGAKAIFQWEAGSLVQDSWHDVWQLGWVSLGALAMVRYLMRNLYIMQLSDIQAKSLGVSVLLTRLLSFLVAAYLIATCISLVGMIGFIGLASASMVNQVQVTDIRYKLLLTYLAGALLLLVTDLLITLLSFVTATTLPTGTITAFIGAPLLLYLIFRALPKASPLSPQTSLSGGRQHLTSVQGAWVFGGLLLATMSMTMVSLLVSKNQAGFIWLGELSALRDLQLPRTLTALGCGMLLSISGLLLQRLTHNPLASPELLGISAGASIAVIIAVLWLNTLIWPLWSYGLIGALLTFAFIFMINLKNRLQPDKVILTGLAIATLLSALLRLLLASGDPRAQALLVWLSGSTYASQLDGAMLTLSVASMMLVLILLLNRYFTLLLLPATIAGALGLNVNRVRLLLITLVTLMITFATLQIGPLSFIGLVVPLIIHLLGLREGRISLLCCALLGASMMLLADWLGRTLLFPYELPAGLVATLLGGSVFLFLMKRV